jgi:hypothetical protein
LNKGSSLDIKPKEEAHLLNEKKEQEKWKKISTIF